MKTIPLLYNQNLEMKTVNGNIPIGPLYFLLFFISVIMWLFFLICSEGKKLEKLILSDLYYHLQGELEGRKIGIGPFKELCQFLVESNFLGAYQRQFNEDSFAKNLYLFDLIQLRADLRLDVWDCSDWKTCKEIAETMLHFLQDANSFMLLSRSKLSALKELIAVLAIYHDDVRINNPDFLSLHFSI